MKDVPLQPRIVRCPTCRGENVYARTNPYRPFCSARCKSNDFGAWATENYRLEPPGAPGAPEDPSTLE